MVAENCTYIPPQKQNKMVAIENAVYGECMKLFAFCSVSFCCACLMQNCFSRNVDGYVSVWVVCGSAVGEVILFLSEPSRSWAL